MSSRLSRAFASAAAAVVVLIACTTAHAGGIASAIDGSTSSSAPVTGSAPASVAPTTTAATVGGTIQGPVTVLAPTVAPSSTAASSIAGAISDGGAVVTTKALTVTTAGAGSIADNISATTTGSIADNISVTTTAVPAAAANGSATTSNTTGASGNGSAVSDPFNTVPIYTATTESKWVGAKGSPANGYHFYGLSYSPFGLGDNLLCPPFNNTGGQCLLPTQVEKDMKGLAKLTSRIKTYSSVCANATRQILLSARAQNQTVMLGVWINTDAKSNAAEIDRAIKILYEFQDIITEIQVGNEAIFIIRVAPKVVENAIVQIRKRMVTEANVSKKIPIGFADIYNTLMSQPTMQGDIASPSVDIKGLVAASDWIGLNSHSYWGGIDPLVNDSGAHVANGQAQVAKRWNKTCIITETGYPTKGKPHTTGEGTANTGEREQSKFFQQMEAVSRKQGLAVYSFEPFNSDWKRRWQPFEESDYSFGIATCDRVMKAITLPPLGAL
jgi:exo-beta-1,3-glucanase (GH17 family)